MPGASASDPFWEELFPAEQARIVRALVKEWWWGLLVPTSGYALWGWPAWFKASLPSRQQR